MKYDGYGDGVHNWGEFVETRPATAEQDGEERRTCPHCNKTETRPIQYVAPDVPEIPDIPETPETPDTPEIPDTPDIPDDGADDDGGYTPAVTVIEDQEVPLAGLLPLHQLLEELRLHEEIPEAELPEDFKWLDHEHAQAICWASRSSWWLTPGRSPLIPTRSLL